MPNEVLRKSGDWIVFAGSSFNPSVVFSASRTVYAITLGGVTTAASRQSVKADLGARRAPAYNVYATIEFTGAAPTNGNAVELYWAPSPNATAGSGNVAGVSGADAAYAPAGTSADDGGVTRMQHIGQLTVADSAAIQSGFVGTFSPASRYGSLIVKNESGATLYSSDNEEHSVWFEPVIDEVQ